jgi:hypothetical protein
VKVGQVWEYVGSIYHPHRMILLTSQDDEFYVCSTTIRPPSGGLGTKVIPAFLWIKKHKIIKFYVSFDTGMAV